METLEHTLEKLKCSNFIKKSFKEAALHEIPLVQILWEICWLDNPSKVLLALVLRSTGVFFLSCHPSAASGRAIDPSDEKVSIVAA